jgi:hypothetical protein
LHDFTDIDQQNHVVWIALSRDETELHGLGIARFIRIQNQPTIAEFGIVVIDSYQQRGLGIVLMSLLYRIASIQGIEILRGFVLPDNTVMSNWLGRLGADGIFENDLYQMDLTVGADLFAGKIEGFLPRLIFECQIILAVLLDLNDS